ncbi:MAG: hypothetical protein U0V70_16150 [Terriglobia bacterium]
MESVDFGLSATGQYPESSEQNQFIDLLGKTGLDLNLSHRDGTLGHGCFNSSCAWATDPDCHADSPDQ